jgi:hypothetical protein
MDNYRREPRSRSMRERSEPNEPNGTAHCRTKKPAERVRFVRKRLERREAAERLLDPVPTYYVSPAVLQVVG